METPFRFCWKTRADFHLTIDGEHGKIHNCKHAAVVESVDTRDLKSLAPKSVRVRVPPAAPHRKKPAPFRFRGFRKSRENCISACSFLLLPIEARFDGVPVLSLRTAQKTRFRKNRVFVIQNPTQGLGVSEALEAIDDKKSRFDEVTNYEKREKPRSKCDPSGRRI